MRKNEKEIYNNNDRPQIIEEIKNNNETVLKDLYVSNYHKTEHFVLKNNGSVAQAKDIFQEAYITVWKKIKNNHFFPNNKSEINGYLFTVAKNKWMDYLRSTHYKKKTTIEKIETIKKVNKHFETVDNKNDYEDKLYIAKQAFDKLATPCKELLTKFYFEKKSIKTIARELSLDKASTRNKKYRCMQKLRELVALNFQKK